MKRVFRDVDDDDVRLQTILYLVAGSNILQSLQRTFSKNAIDSEYRPLF